MDTVYFIFKISIDKHYEITILRLSVYLYVHAYIPSCLESQIKFGMYHLLWAQPALSLGVVIKERLATIALASHSNYYNWADQ